MGQGILSIRKRAGSHFFRYGSGLFLILLAIGLRFLLNPILGSRYPFITFLIPVVVIAWYAGFGPSIVTIAVGLLAADFLFMEPRYSLVIEGTANRLGFVLYACEGVTVAFLAAGLKKAVRRAEVGEEHLRATFARAPVGLAHVGLDGRWLQVNERLCEITGYARDDLLQKNFQETTPLEDLPADLINTDRLWDGDINRFFLEKRSIRRDGSLVWINFTVSLLREDGEPKYYIVAIEDIAQRKQTEEKLRRTVERLELLSEVSSRLLSSHRPQEIVESLCRKMVEHLDCDLFLNYLVDPQRGRLHLNASGGVSPELAKKIEWLDIGEAASGWVAREGCRLVAENLFHIPDSRTELLQDLGLQLYACYPLMNQDQVIGTLAVGSRSRATLHEDELALLKVVADQVAIAVQRLQLLDSVKLRAAEAQAANTAKSQFLANISHEVRTPMNAILGMTELALTEPLTPPVKDYLETVKESADVLLTLLNEILDFSRIESGKFVLESASFGLRATLADAIKGLGVRAQEKGLTLTCNVEAEVPDALVGDALRLRQVLVNLVGNAIKFTERGSVGVYVTADSRTADEVELCMEVRDTGIGIAAEDQQRIFAPFAQADSSTTRRYGGTGLGLAIAASLVHLMGGEIRVKSEPGRGSTFSFHARFLVTSEAHVQPVVLPPYSLSRLTGAADRVGPWSPAARSLRVLLVEDTPANQKLVLRVLQKRGHHVELAGNGREAIEWAMSQPFDVILMDVQMPVMDGFQATQAIREASEPHLAHVPIIAMTAHAMKGDQERCLAAGMDAYLAKPVNSRELIDLVERCGAASGPH